jgi:hypothetical protein
VKRAVGILFLTALSSCLAAAADFAILNLTVVEGEGVVYALGSRATRGITVQVTDETGRAVPNVAVSFRLPDSGATGVFQSGGRTEIITTGADGRASVWGMKWNRTPGDVQVRITAAKDGVRAGIISTQHLSAQAASDPGPISMKRGFSSKLLLIGLITAAAVGGGAAVAAARRGGSNSSSSSGAPPPITIGQPTIIVGAPQ